MTGKRQSEALAKPYEKNLVALADHNAGSLPLCGRECLSVLRFLRPFRHSPAWCRLIDLFCRLCLTFHPFSFTPSLSTSTLLQLPPQPRIVDQDPLPRALRRHSHLPLSRLPTGSICSLQSRLHTNLGTIYQGILGILRDTCTALFSG